MVGFGCEAHLAAILASVQVPAHAMLYWDWLATPSIAKMPPAGPAVPPASSGQ
jgi:hypothetical protein